MKRKPKQWEDEPETNYIGGTGQYQRIGGVGKVKTAQIGFIRNENVVKVRVQNTNRLRKMRG